MRNLNASAIQDKIIDIAAKRFSFQQVLQDLRVIDDGTIDLITQLEGPLMLKFKTRVIRFRRDRTYI